MEYIKLAATDLEISKVGFGCEPLGGSDWGKVDDRLARAAVERAVELGINFFDTADVYGLGRSEEVLADVLGQRRHEVVIATKFGVNWRTDPGSKRAVTFRDSSPRHLAKALENSLRRLRIDCIPLYFIHWPDPNTPVRETFEALQRYQQAGKIENIGVSNFSAEQVVKANKIVKLTAVQLPYSLLNRDAERDLLPCCEKLGIHVLAYGVLAQGLLSGKYGPESEFDADDRRHRLAHFQGKHLQSNLRVVNEIKKSAEASGRSAAQVAIRWVLDNHRISSAIVGAKTPQQAEENAQAIE